MFVRALNKTAALYKKHGKPTGRNYATVLLRGHKEPWLALPLARRLLYEEDALEYREVLKEKHAARTRQLKDEIADRTARLRRRTVEGGTSVRLGLCRFSEADLEGFDELFYDGDWSSQRLQEGETDSTCGSS